MSNLIYFFFFLLTEKVLEQFEQSLIVTVYLYEVSKVADNTVSIPEVKVVYLRKQKVHKPAVFLCNNSVLV